MFDDDMPIFQYCSRSERTFTCVIVGVFLIALAIILLCKQGNDIKFYCNRLENFCKIEKTDFLGIKTQTVSMKFSEIESAGIAKGYYMLREQGSRHGGHYIPPQKVKTCSVLLHMKSGDIPITKQYISNFDKCERDARHLNKFIKSNEDVFQFVNYASGQLKGIIMLMAFMGIALIAQVVSLVTQE